MSTYRCFLVNSVTAETGSTKEAEMGVPSHDARSTRKWVSSNCRPQLFRVFITRAPEVVPSREVTRTDPTFAISLWPLRELSCQRRSGSEFLSMSACLSACPPRAAVNLGEYPTAGIRSSPTQAYG
ncbi:hypothetical protein JZ751_003202 [Albula glossodonta]|uniref:Uncharacterized protein n=1 Tax=Albula glossodonta TaxID=121402 RepID=A0A8T2NA79_9TELE|nr:hypothetical protein JZ751_003202 [Albula glossodonta]